MKVTYYFNGHSYSNWSHPDWLDNGDLGSFAYTALDNSYHQFSSNTCPGTDLGTITKVEMRIYGYMTIANGYIGIRPYFDGVAGSTYLLDCQWESPAAWSSWLDITDDDNAPSTWTWADIQALKGRVWYEPSESDFKWAAKVEIRVTYRVKAVAMAAKMIAAGVL